MPFALAKKKKKNIETFILDSKQQPDFSFSKEVWASVYIKRESGKK